MKPIIHYFQIGYGKWGKIAVEKVFQLSMNLRSVDLVLEGVCDIKSDAREELRNFCKEKNINIKIFSHTKDMYRYASGMENVLIFDAGPSELHASHIIKSLEHNFFHLAEKPPYFSKREKHLIEVAQRNSKGKWSCDLIEFLNPVVKEIKKFLKENEIVVKNIDVFRFNSIGIKKILCGNHRYGIQGGCFLDKIVHDGYIFDFIKGNIIFLNSKADSFMNFLRKA